MMRAWAPLRRRLPLLIKREEEDPGASCGFRPQASSVDDDGTRLRSFMTDSAFRALVHVYRRVTVGHKSAGEHC